MTIYIFAPDYIGTQLLAKGMNYWIWESYKLLSGHIFSKQVILK